MQLLLVNYLQRNNSNSYLIVNDTEKEVSVNDIVTITSSTKPYIAVACVERIINTETEKMIFLNESYSGRLYEEYKLVSPDDNYGIYFRRSLPTNKLIGVISHDDTEDIYDLESKINELNYKIDELSKELGICKICNNTTREDEVTSEIKKLYADVLDTKAKIKKIHDKEDTLKGSQDDIQKLLDTLVVRK